MAAMNGGQGISLERYVNRYIPLVLSGEVEEAAGHQ